MTCTRSRADWVLDATRKLNLAGVDSPRLSAVLLLRHGLKLDKREWLAHPERPIPPEALPHLEKLLQRRQAGEPAAYLLGEREFYGRSFLVNKATLIPRPETEHLIEAALARMPASALRFADLGTGSGCIAVTLCAERPQWRGLAADIAAAAVQTARTNSVQHAVHDRLLFVQADFTLPLLADGTLDLLISNPPYVSQPEFLSISPEVRNFEPAAALLPTPHSPEGLEHLRILERTAAAALRPGGLLLMEHAHDQGDAVRLLFSNNTWDNILICKDISEHDRFVVARRAP